MQRICMLNPSKQDIFEVNMQNFPFLESMRTYKTMSHKFNDRALANLTDTRLACWSA